MENLKDQVKEAYDGASEPETREPSEDATSQEVKTDQEEVKEEPKDEPKEETKEETSTKDESDNDDSKTSRDLDEAVSGDDKLSEQVKNLNKALQQERQDKQELKEKFEKVSESTNVIDRMKNLFTEDDSSEQEEEEPEYLTKDELEQYLEEKEQKMEKVQQEQKMKEQISNEIKELSETYNGKDGKPKYSDDEVLKWQEDNKKLHLTPSEAFNEMKRQEIIDYEVSQRMNSKPKDIETEKPSGSSAEHNPEESKPKDSGEIKDAVLEAISSSKAEM